MRDGSVRQDDKPAVSLRAGAPGSEVTVEWTGLAPDGTIVIGFGGLSVCQQGLTIAVTEIRGR